MSEYFHDTDAAAAFRDEKMNKVNLYESHRLFCDVYCLRPGQEQKVHDHADNDKVYHVHAAPADPIPVEADVRWGTLKSMYR